MKNKILVFLIFLALTGPYFGWAMGRSQKNAAAEEDSSLARAGNRRNMGFPQEAVTRPLLEMIYLVKNDIKGVPYFLSDSLTLRYSKTTQNLEISERGEVTLREVTVQDQVHIDRETSGTLVAITYDSEGRMLLAINFDESDDAYPLVFREEGADRAFYLVHQEVGIDGKEKRTHYGQALYDLQTPGGQVPRLQIQFEAIEEVRPTERTLPGHKTSFYQPTPVGEVP
jgi:hypothetical protein